MNMAQRLVTTDDHSGAEIVSGIDTTQASISIIRNGVALTWDELNLTDESWAALTDLLTQFLPGVAPSGQESDNGAEALITEAAAKREAAVATRQDRAPRKTKAATTQAEQRARSKAIRAWWYNLSQVDLKKLGLPTPKDRTVQIGKLPLIVPEVYAQTVEAA